MQGITAALKGILSVLSLKRLFQHQFETGKHLTSQNVKACFINQPCFIISLC